MNEKPTPSPPMTLRGHWTTREVVLVGALIVAITALVAVGTRGLLDYSEENAAIEAECKAKGMDSLFLSSQSVLKMCVTPYGILVLPDLRRKGSVK